MKTPVTNSVIETSHKALEIRSHKEYIDFGWDYAQRSVEKIAAEIQSHNFGGNNYLSIEDVVLEY